jgi:hypothetical protein
MVLNKLPSLQSGFRPGRITLLARRCSGAAPPPRPLPGLGELEASDGVLGGVRASLSHAGLGGGSLGGGRAGDVSMSGP